MRSRINSVHVDSPMKALQEQNKALFSSQKECGMSGSHLVKLLDLSTFDTFLQTFSPAENVFYLETSGRPSLNIRQVCAIESACRNSGRNVFLLLLSENIDVCSEEVWSSHSSPIPAVTFVLSGISPPFYSSAVSAPHKLHHARIRRPSVLHLEEREVKLLLLPNLAQE